MIKILVAFFTVTGNFWYRAHIYTYWDSLFPSFSDGEVRLNKKEKMLRPPNSGNVLITRSIISFHKTHE